MVQRLREPMGDIWAEVRNLGIGIPRALNPPPELPLTPASGQVVHLSEVELQYRGPYIALGIGWGLIPAGMVNFNNGDSLIDGAWGWTTLFAVQPSADWQYYSRALMSYAPVTIPYAGDYIDRGGSTRRLNMGTADTWVWVFNITALLADLLGLEDDSVVLEEYILAIDDDADVVELQEPYAPPPPPAEAGALEVRYAFA